MNKNTPLILHRHAFPVGELEIGSVGEYLVLCDWTVEPRHSKVVKQLSERLDVETQNGTSEVIENTIRELDEYFNSKRTDFDIPVLLMGTEFRKLVWNTLLKVPYGKTFTYMDIANAIKAPKAIRAVGTSIGANPISIIVPCHRIIGSSGSLTGYAGGIPAKRFLLELEASNRYLIKKFGYLI